MNLFPATHSSCFFLDASEPQADIQMKSNHNIVVKYGRVRWKLIGSSIECTAYYSHATFPSVMLWKSLHTERAHTLSRGRSQNAQRENSIVLWRRSQYCKCAVNCAANGLVQHDTQKAKTITHTSITALFPAHIFHVTKNCWHSFIFILLFLIAIIEK